MQEKFYKYLSYLWPIRLESHSSSVTGRLEIFYENGKKVLNGPHSNYSFGSLEQVFDRALRFFQFSPKPTDRLLILGYGGGSLPRILKKRKYAFALCKGVELDPVVISLAQKHFQEYLANIELIEAEAQQYLKSSQQRYDYIFVDLFEDDEVPPQFIEARFVEQLCGKLKPGGRVYQNVMLSTAQEQQLLSAYRQQFDEVNFMRVFERNLVIEAKLLHKLMNR